MTALVKPFLITKDDDGRVHLTMRETRRNSQDYPWVLTTAIEPTFDTASEARAYAVSHLGAQAGDFASK